MPDYDSTVTSLQEAVFDALPLPLFVHTPETILAANALSREMLQAPTADALHGRPLMDIVHPDGREAGEQRRALLFERDQRFAGVRVKLVTLSGVPLALTVTATSFSVGNDRIAVVAACDVESLPELAPGIVSVSPRFDADTPLVEAVLSALPFPIMVASSAEITYVNDATCSALRATGPHELLGRPVQETLHPDAMETLMTQMALTMEQGIRFDGVRAKSIALDGSVVTTIGRTGGMRYDGAGMGIWVATRLGGS